MFGQILVYIITSLISYALRPKPSTPPPSSVKPGEVEAPTVSQSDCIPVVFGTVKIENPNIVWYGNTRNEPITETYTTEGGK